MSDIPDKRIVLEYTQGPLSGMLQIAGIAQGVSPFIQGPFCVGPTGRTVESASLIAVKQRYLHYREVVDRSHMAGRLGDYLPGTGPGNMDPKQV